MRIITLSVRCGTVENKYSCYTFGGKKVETKSTHEDDLVQVVRCKDCKYYATESCPMVEWSFEATDPNGFCNYGERKENN